MEAMIRPTPGHSHMASDVRDLARARVTPTPLNIVSNRALETIPEAMARGANTVIAASLHDVTRALEAQAARPRGATTIDALDLGVRRFFEHLARSGILRDINAVCLRLIGCETALSVSGQRTMRLLAAVLGMPVYGTRKRISRMHNTELGFRPLFEHLLGEAAPRKAPWLLAMATAPS